MSEPRNGNWSMGNWYKLAGKNWTWNFELGLIGGHIPIVLRGVNKKRCIYSVCGLEISPQSIVSQLNLDRITTLIDTGGGEARLESRIICHFPLSALASWRYKSWASLGISIPGFETSYFCPKDTQMWCWPCPNVRFTAKRSCLVPVQGQWKPLWES